MKVLKILKNKAQDHEVIFDRDKKKPGLKFAPESPDLIGTSPDTNPDVSVPLHILYLLALVSRCKVSSASLSFETKADFFIAPAASFGRTLFAKVDITPSCPRSTPVD